MEEDYRLSGYVLIRVAGTHAEQLCFGEHTVCPLTTPEEHSPLIIAIGLLRGKIVLYMLACVGDSNW